MKSGGRSFTNFPEMLVIVAAVFVVVVVVLLKVLF